MKKWQFYTIIALIIIGFGIVIYQNKKQLDYLWGIDTIIRGIDINVGVIHENTVKGL